MSRTIKLLISNWPRTREFSQLLQTGKLLSTFLTMVTRWSRSTSNFYALIGQNLTGEFMRKIYAASWNLFTDSWNWRSFVYKRCEAFNCLFLLDAQNEIQMLARFLRYSWLVVYCFFGWEMRRLSKSSEIRFRMDRFYSLPLAWCVL